MGSESWEISAHLSDPSVIVGGKCKGATLREVFPNFPLLFKVIGAKMRFSVQVHPNEETCKVTGGEPKTEMWCALSDGPVYAGLKKGTSVLIPPSLTCELFGSDSILFLTRFKGEGRTT